VFTLCWQSGVARQVLLTLHTTILILAMTR
jgi:hypothetical protein